MSRLISIPASVLVMTLASAVHAEESADASGDVEEARASEQEDDRAAATDLSRAGSSSAATGDESSDNATNEAEAVEDDAKPAVPASIRRYLDGGDPMRQMRPKRASGGSSASDRPEAGSTRRARSRSRVPSCEEAPRPAGEQPFQPGESFTYDVDIMGMRAGRLTIGVEASGAGPLSFSATTRTNSFFANIRDVDGRATSYTRDSSLLPVRYREDSTEDGVRKWSEVLFPSKRSEVDVRFGVDERERRVRYPVMDSPLDVLSLVYYLRTLELEVGEEICLDVFASRRIWRVRADVTREEFIRTPAGGFETVKVSGTAQRIDRPNVEREVHFWFAKDEKRTPVAAMSRIDLGPVRARLTRLDEPSTESRRSSTGGGRW